MFTKDQLKPVVILLYTIVAATVWRYCAFPHFAEKPTLAEFWQGTTPIFAALVLFGFVPICPFQEFCEIGLYKESPFSV